MVEKVREGRGGREGRIISTRTLDLHNSALIRPLESLESSEWELLKVKGAKSHGKKSSNSRPLF